MNYLLPLLCMWILIQFSCKPGRNNDSCMGNPGNGKFLVFVGKKIAVNYVESKGMDGTYKGQPCLKCALTCKDGTWLEHPCKQVNFPLLLVNISHSQALSLRYLHCITG